MARVTIFLEVENGTPQRGEGGGGSVQKTTGFLMREVLLKRYILHKALIQTEETIPLSSITCVDFKGPAPRPSRWCILPTIEFFKARLNDFILQDSVAKFFALTESSAARVTFHAMLTEG